MSVSPADFELYSRMTGAPMPNSPQEQMQMAPEVYNFVRNRDYEPSKLRKAANFIGKAALLGGAAYAANKYLGNQEDNTERSTINVASDDINDNDAQEQSFLASSSPKGPKNPPNSVVDRGGSVINNVSIEKDDDPWDLPKYDRDKEDPRLVRQEKEPGGSSIRERVENFANKHKVEQYVPLSAIPLGGGVVAHQAMDAAKIMGGVDPASIGSYHGYPIGQGVTDLANRGLTSVVDHVPYVGHGAVEAVKGVGHGLEGAASNMHWLGNKLGSIGGGFVGDMATNVAHLPPFEVMGNAIDAAGHVIQTGTPELILGGLGVAGGTAAVGAARAALKGEKDVKFLKNFVGRLTGKGLNLYDDHPQIDGPGADQARIAPSVTIQGDGRIHPGGAAGLGAHVESEDIHLDGSRDRYNDLINSPWR